MSKQDILDEIEIVNMGGYKNINKKQLLQKIENIQSMTKSLEYLSRIKDVDTAMADAIRDADLEQTGMFEELCKIYKDTQDAKSFESLFELFTDLTFEEFLTKCIATMKTNFSENSIDKGYSILSESEYNGLNKIVTANKLDWFMMTQFEDKDYIIDLENGVVMFFKEGLAQVNESICQEQPDYDADYHMTKDERDAVVDLFKENNISTNL